MQADSKPAELPGKPQYTKVQTNTVWFHLYTISRIVKFIESERTLVDARGLG